jgi:6-phosphogluconolactonase
MFKKLAFLIYFLMTFNLLAQTTKEYIYVGTYSQRDSKGIYVFEFDRAKGTLKEIQTVSNIKNPSFLEVHPSGRFLYAVSELDEMGAGASFSLDPKTGKLAFINQESSKGGGACHISVDKTGKFAFISNYGGGNLAVLPIEKNGALKPASQVIQYEGSSIDKERQTSSHVHSAFLSPDNKLLLVSDLGTDKINIYSIDYKLGKLSPASTPFIKVAPGAGPRHLAFNPNGKYIYSAEELYSTIAVLGYDEKTGSVKILTDSVKSLPSDFKEFNKSADIHTDPSGKFLYMSNRGLDVLSIFSIKEDGAKIELLGQQEVMGKFPRNFFVDPKGEYVFVANQNTDNIVIFKLDGSTGKLTYTGNQVKVPAPVCIKMHSVR